MISILFYHIVNHIFRAWRIGGIRDLTWDRVDLKRGAVRIDPGGTKNDDGRTVYLPPEPLETLRTQHSQRRLGCPYVSHRNGKPVGDFRKTWVEACKLAEVRDKLFHVLRRTAVRNLIRSLVPREAAMLISGHKTPSVCSRYAIVSEGDLKEASERLGRYIPRCLVATI